MRSAVSLFVLFFIFLLIRAKNKKERRLNSIINTEQIIVTLTETLLRASGRSGVYQYKCKGQLFETIEVDPPLGYTIGEKYIAIIDELDCESIKIQYEKPVFTESEGCKITEAKISMIMSVFSRPFVKFKYSVNNEEYVRVQYMVKGFKRSYPMLRKGNKVQVRYWIQNPKRAMLILK